MAILAQDSDDDMKELTDALTDGQRAKLAEFLATQEAEEARDQESWASLFLCAGVEGLPVETVAKALVRGGVEMDSEKREVLAEGTPPGSVLRAAENRTAVMPRTRPLKSSR